MPAHEARQDTESFAADCIAALATMSGDLVAYGAWWRPRAVRINRLSVDAPRAWNQVAAAIDAMHYRRRRHEQGKG